MNGILKNENEKKQKVALAISKLLSNDVSILLPNLSASRVPTCLSLGEG